MRIAALFLLSLPLLAQGRNPYLNPGRWLNQEQKQALVKRLLIDREPFLSSAEATEAPGSLGLFFRHEDYRVLQGNPGIGYFVADGGFEWPAAQKEVSFQPFTSAPGEPRRIKAEAWTRAMEVIAKRHGWKITEGAPVRIRGMCVYARLQPGPQARNPLVTVEVRITSPKGEIRYRKSHVGPTPGDAIGSCLDFILGFASTYGQGEPAPVKRSCQDHLLKFPVRDGARKVEGGTRG